MNRFLRSVVAIAAGVVFVSPAHAATYYVRTSGNNSNSGTGPGAAWRTVAHAVDNVSAGDIIYVGAGTYGEEITPSGDGTSGSRILVIADTTGSQTGDAGSVLLQRAGRVMQLSGDDYWTFAGFTFDRTNASGHVVEVSSSTGVTFERCTFTGGDDGIRATSATGLVLDRCTFEANGDEGAQITGGTFTITGCTFDDLQGTNSGGLAAGIYAHANALGTVDASTFSNTPWGIWVDGGADLTITNSVFTDLDEGYYQNDSGSVCVIAHGVFYNISGDGIDVAQGNLTVRNTIFSVIGDDCMDDNGGTISSNSTIHHSHGGSRSEGFGGSNERAGDPEFVDESAGDFRVESGSMAIDAGVDASSYTALDYWGGARPTGSAWDIGIHEYGSIIYTAADVPYTTDFSTIGDEWVGELAGNDSDVGDFIGPYGDSGGVESGATLYLNTTAGTTYTVTFDLLIIDSWDGTHGSWGPDSLRVSVEGAAAFDEYFASSSSDQSYAGTPDSSGTWVGTSGWTDYRYDAVTFTFVAADSETEIEWIGALSEDISNESWALLGVTVTDVPPVFVDVTDTVNFGVDTGAENHDGSGWHWADLDGDGDLDAFVSGSSARVLTNDLAGGTFTVASMGNIARGTAMLDADGDGDVDFFNADHTSEKLLENSGGLLTNRGAAGVDGPSNTETVFAIDIDLDGDGDLVIPAQNGNWIAINHGDGYNGNSPAGFEDSKELSDGMNDGGDYGNGDYGSSADVNNDGHLDFFVNYGSGKLFKSDGDGTYTEDASGISVYVNNSYKFGSAWGDFDNDGDMDLFAPNSRSGYASTLWRNASDGLAFSDVASSSGVVSTVITRSGAWGDYDNDGDLDLYVTSGSGEPNQLYTNNGDNTFTLDDHGAGLTGDYQDAVFVDYDNDGDLDLALSRLDGDGETVLLQNQTDDDRYLKVRLVGAGAINTLGIGARVQLFDPSGPTLLGTREIGTARGFGGTEPLWAHFGGVDPSSTYTLRVTWPGGSSQEVSVTPSAVSTTIGSTTIDQMVTVQASSGVRFVRWREVAPSE